MAIFICTSTSLSFTLLSYISRCTQIHYDKFEKHNVGLVMAYQYIIMCNKFFPTTFLYYLYSCRIVITTNLLKQIILIAFSIYDFTSKYFKSILSRTRARVDQTRTRPTNVVVCWQITTLLRHLNAPTYLLVTDYYLSILYVIVYIINIHIGIRHNEYNCFN